MESRDLKVMHTYVRKVSQRPDEMAANSGQGHSLANLLYKGVALYGLLPS